MQTPSPLVPYLYHSPEEIISLFAKGKLDFTKIPGGLDFAKYDAAEPRSAVAAVAGEVVGEAAGGGAAARPGSGAAVAAAAARVATSVFL